MGLDTKRPPLPAPTEPSTLDSADDSNLRDDVDTNVSTRTDKTSYSVPEDGTPITINTTTPTKHHGGGVLHKKFPSQTSLLIEYFEAGKTEGKARARPSVRVRVTPSSRKSKNTTATDHVQITQTSRNPRKPSYIRRISLGSKPRDELIDTRTIELSDGSNVSSLPPVDIEVLPNLSDDLSSNGGRFIPMPSDVSSMPADSMTGATEILPPRRRSRSLEREAVTESMIADAVQDTLKAPKHERSRSLSKDRITQRVMEKLQQQAGESGMSKSKDRSTKSRETSRRREDELASPRKSHRRRSKDVEEVSGTESSLLSSNADRRSGITHSARSGVSGTSSINNPKLLATVEDAIKRLILPELNALKEENRTSRNRDKFERINRDSSATQDTVESPTSSREPSRRRVSKSSSAPKLHGNKPKVVLNRDGDDPGTLLSGGSSRKGERRSSRGSISSYAESTTTRDEKSSHRRKSKEKDSKSTRDAALAGLAGAGLTAAALKHHTSREEKEEERKHSKHRSSRSSRSRSASVTESVHEEVRVKERVPPLPFNHSELIGGSELTRDSILSAETETKERPQSRSSTSTGVTGAETPLQQVPRGYISPSPRTPTRTPNALQQTLGASHSNRSVGDVRLATPKSERSYTSRSKEVTDAGLSAAAAAKARAIERSEPQTSQFEIESETQSRRAVSPIQSEASYREDAHTSGSPRRFHSIRSGPSVSSLGHQFERRESNLSIASLDSTASTKAARTRKRPQGVTLESKRSILNEPNTPRDTEDFFERNHEQNELYRRELEDSSLASPVNYNRMTNYTDDSAEGQYLDHEEKMDLQDIRKVGSNPEYVHTPLAVESAVASLHDPSSISVRSSMASSPLKKSLLSQVSPSPAAYVQTDSVPAGERWAAIRGKAEALAQERHVENSPRQSIAQSVDARSVDETPQMHHSAYPVSHDDMMPEIGYGIDDDSDVTTNPSIIQGPIGGGESYQDHTDELLSRQEERERTPTSLSRGPAVAAGGAAAAAIAADAAAHQRHEQDSPASFDHQHQATVEDDYDHPYPGELQYEQSGYAQSNRTPLSGQTGWKDEGYQSANQREAYTPQNRNHSKVFDDDGYGDEFDEADFGGPDMFATRNKHDRQVSGNSHGMASPLYDAATGKGIDRIQSKDIVALMDHLTVRDAQRNARDTEILVTLVRSAAEMRNQLDDLKQFIKTQDNMIVNTTDKRVNLAEQRILGGPRPQPMTSPRVNRSSSEDIDIETKKKSVFRRALKGLSAGKGDADMKHIESMLVQLLDEVEGLKQVNQLSLDQQARSNSLTSYENLRASGDPGYEPEGRANTASSPNQSGYLSNPSSSRRIQDLHSGYDVVPTNRISTVREESDEEYEDRRPQYENTERMTTPTQEAFQQKNGSLGTPPQASRANRDSQSQENTPKRKHKSNSSSIFGIPKISRWSKTTSSTNPESLPRNSGSGERRPYSAHSRSSSQDDYYDDEEPYEQHIDDRLRSNTSLARDERASIRSARSPSPLIPEEHEYEMEDPKYQAHRNSLNLQHPQPRPGPTGRHQSNLETQAQIYEPVRSDVGSPDYDQWGSMPSLARNRLSGGPAAQGAGNLSPISSDGGYSQHSASEQQAAPPRPPKIQDDGPLIPPQQVLAGYGQTRQMYSSPNEFGSQGALTPLAPIAEVRYSLETDRGNRMTPTPSPRPSNQHLRANGAMNSPQRKITGPRPMGSRSPQPHGNSPLQHADTVIRRKPIAADEESLESYRSSLDSEIF
ncbi:hypothetical protein BDW02DRAFT_178819 [Decorospora gaudefroyi]|uniref:Uncharacterized protein n=1 Tax=Decorospora gaudefroyi TaxID=184978 RepID=A0A6A5K762_9PLEO|nr:hypothetical protein BDW02DRAFT_178819 [Decorospora gaudefroyi]